MSNLKNTIGGKILTPEFRVSFCSVFTPALNQQGKEIFEVTMLFDKKTDLGDIKLAVNNLVKKVFPKGAPPNLRSPLRDGDEPNSKGNIFDGFLGCFYFRAWSKNKPGIVDQYRQDIISPSEFYSGCYARATITPFVYDTAGNIGVSFFLNNIQKLRDGEPLGSASGNAKDDFEDVPGGSDDPNAYSNNDDVFGDTQQTPPSSPPKSGFF